MRPIARLLAALSVAAAAAVQAQMPTLAPPDGVLALSATATVEVTRDLLAVTFSTTKEGADARAVQAELQRALDAALAEARRAARPGQLDVQTGNFSLFPRQGRQPGIQGWQGTAELVVEGRDMAAIGALAGRITTMTVARVQQRLSREATQKVEGELAAEAITRFRAKAAEYARHFGYAATTVREVTVTTSDPPPGPIPMMRMQAAAPAGEALAIEPGRTQVSATVNGTVQMR